MLCAVAAAPVRWLLVLWLAPVIEVFVVDVNEPDESFEDPFEPPFSCFFVFLRGLYL